MSHFPLEYIRHILDEIKYINGQVQGLDKDEFSRDETLKRAFVRSLEIIGEASKRISAELKQKYSQIDWRAMAGMRDKLIHNYFGIDYDIVWDVVINKVPELHRELEKILKNEDID